MRNPSDDKDVLRKEIEQLKERLQDAEEILDAIRTGRVDALVIPGPEGDQIYSLEGSDQSYRFMVETMNEGALVISEAGVILYCNRRFADMYGRGIKEIIGREDAELFHSADRAHYTMHRKKAFQKHGSKAEIRLIASHRKETPVLLSMRHFQFEDLDAVCMVVTDLTELKNKEKLLSENARELEAKNIEIKRRAAQLGRMSSELTMAEHRERQRLAKILHDHLQQLLVSARFNLEILEGRIPDEQWRPVGNAIELIAESLDASRSLSIELSPPVLYEGGLIPALEWLVRWIKEKQGLTVTLIEQDARGCFMRNDMKTLLFSAVRELLLNVVKHAGTAEARVEVSCHNSRYVDVTVIDCGTGFHPGQCLNEPDESTSGFGLFSIRERLQVLGGQCRVASSPGQGTSISLIVPLDAAAAEEAIGKMDDEMPAEPQSAEAIHDQGQIRSNIQIMLVDDHDMVRQGLSTILSGQPDIEVVGEAADGEAADGEAAVNLARELDPDIILMDISMPKMNGIEATRIIRSENPGIHIIGLSMFDAADQADAIREAGAIAYLKKSGNKNELLQTIHKTASLSHG